MGTRAQSEPQAATAPATVASPSPSPSPSARSALELAGLVVAPTTLVTALAFYFGWVLTNSRASYFGIDASALGFSTQDYLLRSADALFVPLGTALVLALGSSGCRPMPAVNSPIAAGARGCGSSRGWRSPQAAGCSRSRATTQPISSSLSKLHDRRRDPAGRELHADDHLRANTADGDDLRRAGRPDSGGARSGDAGQPGAGDPDATVGAAAP